MKTIVIAHQKGGVGKSTLTINIANCLSLSGSKVAVIDTDLQGTTYMTLQNENIDLFSSIEQFQLSSTKCDYLVVDTPPFNMSNYETFFNMSDLLVIPTQLNVPDILAIEATLQYFNNSKNANKKAMVVLNRIKGSANYSSVIERLEQIKGAAVIGESRVVDRVSFSNSILSDNAIFSSDDEKAKSEIESLTNEIISLL